jgi:ATP-dependent DNA ligase
MMLHFLLVAGDTRIDCGSTAPVYNKDRGGWVTAVGIVSAFAENEYQVATEEVEAVPAGPSPELLTMVAAQMDLVVGQHINDQAKALRYESIVTAVGYADEPAVPKYQAEGRALRAWRSRVYARRDELQDEIEKGVRPIPSTIELIALLPEFVAPA